MCRVDIRVREMGMERNCASCPGLRDCRSYMYVKLLTAEPGSYPTYGKKSSKVRG